MWLIVVMVLVLASIGGYVVYLLIQQKSIVSTQPISQVSPENVFAHDLQGIRIKHPLFVELKSHIQEHIIGMDGFIHALFVALLAQGHVLVE